MPSPKPSLKAARRDPYILGWAPPGLVAGVDEAGRGPLAGPVLAAAVMLDARKPITGLRDSKRLSARRREQLADQIRDRALCCCVAQASVAEIDQLNILQATLLAMQRAVSGLRLRPTLVLVDGNRLPQLACPAQAVVKGDNCVAAIAAASILAKVERDRLCLEWHQQRPEYGFASHKGYGTAAHLLALQQHGPSPWHRCSFAPVAALVLKAAGAQPTAGPPRRAQVGTDGACLTSSQAHPLAAVARTA